MLVATMIVPTSSAFTPAWARALRAASAASVALLSLSATMCRDLMPVCETIHSSVVSSVFESSTLSTTRTGKADPIPVIWKFIGCTRAS